MKNLEGEGSVLLVRIMLAGDYHMLEDIIMLARIIIAGVDTLSKKSYLGDNEQCSDKLAARKQNKKWEGKYLGLGMIREGQCFKIPFKIFI